MFRMCDMYTFHLRIGHDSDNLLLLAQGRMIKRVVFPEMLALGGRGGLCLHNKSHHAEVMRQCPIRHPRGNEVEGSRLAKGDEG